VSSSESSCDLEEQFLQTEGGRATSDDAEVTVPSSSEAPVGCSFMIGGGDDLLRDELLLLFELVVFFEIFFVFVGLLFSFVGSLFERA